MSDNKNIDVPPDRQHSDVAENIAPPSSEVSSVAGSVKTSRTPLRISSSSERLIKFERAHKCLENAALVSKRIKEHRKATAELLGRPFEEDDGDTVSEMASTMSEKTGYSAATDTSTTLSVQDALNIPGISESLANTLKQKELLMERIKQYKEISKRPAKTSTLAKKESKSDIKLDIKKSMENNELMQLTNTIREKDNALSIMQVKMKAMETTILDLQEKINEKDQIIEAKVMATTLMSDSLSKKEKDSLDLLEDTKQQMTKMQENFIAMETEWKEEKQRLLKDIETKEEMIISLDEANKILESSRFEISLAHSKLGEELDLKNNEIVRLTETIQNLNLSSIENVIETEKEKSDFEEEKGSREITGMVELTRKIELLEQLNCQIRQTNKELENKLANINIETKSPPIASPSKKGSPLPTRKGGRNTASKMKSPWSQLSSETLHQDTDKKVNKNEIARLEMLLQSLNKDILEKEYVISEKEAIILELQSTNNENETRQSHMVDIGICTEVTESGNDVEKHDDDIENKSMDDNPFVDTKELEEKLQCAQKQITSLNNEIDSANKNMIKVKSNNKLKIKQMQKTIDNFSKVSEANAEIIRLNEELHQLSQKVAELEEEKGNLQLHLVDYDSGRLTESDIFKKMVEMENLAEARLKAISMLETQKFDLVQELHVLQQKYNEMEDKLADISQVQSEHVCTEIKSVQLEEQIDGLIASKNELELVIENIKLDKVQLNGTIHLLEEEKVELMQKLENYIQENMELTDKLEKLSAEKVSSAESIEIVDSLTTQEKLEIEEYNKGIIEDQSDEPHTENISPSNEENIEKLIEQSADLRQKVELFTQEREEVMEKMSKISAENKLLHEKIANVNHQCETLQNNIDSLNNQKHELLELNQELTHQIEELKRERIEVLKDSVEITKPLYVEDTVDSAYIESQHDDKSAGDKGNSRTKSVKQLTKEILKLKNTIKEREDEIGDCQMKILSLEEQQQKQNELLQANASVENKIKCLIDENHNLKQEIDVLKKDKESEHQLLQYKYAHDLLQQDIQKLHQDYSVTVNTRDSRISELENLLLEYEKQIFNYNSILQQKDKEMTEYINQITKLNDVSQKLKSTIELLEEEKAKDQNAELVKTLNKQITVFQIKLSETEERLRTFEDEKSQLLSLKGALDIKNTNLENELMKLQEAITEKQNIIKELQVHQQKHSDEMSTLMLQTKERDEEIHEIKLQLRKESIENEKLRTSLSEKEKTCDYLNQALDEAKVQLDQRSHEEGNLQQEYMAIETKNKELMEKLKKFAINFKKKSAMYTDLEATLIETQKQLEIKNDNLEQLAIQVETLPALQEKFKHAEEEINRLQLQKVTIDQQKSQDIIQLRAEVTSLQTKLLQSEEQISKLSDTLTALQKDLHFTREENVNLKAHIELLNNKLVDYEIELKNNTNFVTKITSLEADISQKQMRITDLSSELELHKQQQSQIQFGYDAKLQESDLYMESLEAEISKYKNRICRLEESISVMEGRRNSLERKADQLDNQLQEKQKAYSEYTSQEDELVNRLAVLMDHDRVVEKRLYEIDNENKELQYKVQHLTEDNQRLKKTLSDIQEHCNTLVDKASKADVAQSEVEKYQSQLHNLESNLKRITLEYQTLVAQNKKEIEELELEFNTQIESAIKEKKVLSEKYEKVIEHEAQLELKLQEYRSNIENLNMHVEELTRTNQELIEKSSNNENELTPDYTEQYINEINKLNSIVNNKTEEISGLNSKIHTVQTNSLAVISDLESKISNLTADLNNSLGEVNHLVNESNNLKQKNEELQTLLIQKDEQLKELKDTKKLTFEMNIPKTEGMVISSTIEALNEDPKVFDMSLLESQIISDFTQSPLTSKDKVTTTKEPEKIQKQSVEHVGAQIISEPIITPKKAYICYTSEEGNNTSQEPDLFNSDEGWGLGESEEIGDVTPGLSHLTGQLQKLKEDNDALKSELNTTNTKLMKALKKLKELKSSNDMLSNDLKLTKQISQSSFLDTAIEDELKVNIQELENKVEELKSDLAKEKRDKDSLRKQNEVFHNANDRLTEIKEKLDNEIELWKYKFKEANDKLSTLQWSADQDSPQHEIKSSIKHMNENKIKDEIIKIEKENDELQTVIEQLTSQNNELVIQQTHLKNEISNLNNQLHKHLNACEKCESLNKRVLELQQSNNELQTDNDVLCKKMQDLEIRFNDATHRYDSAIINHEKTERELVNENKELLRKCSTLEEEFKSLEQLHCDANNKVMNLITELEATKSNILLQEEKKIQEKDEDVGILRQQCNLLEKECSNLKSDLEIANNRISEFQSENEEFVKQSKTSNERIEELNTKIQNLNIENDSLLSTVAELRSSVSSAVDQRGFEIAELWKQHLSQREADFQKIELELRNQISTSEAKYEQLLDNVQSSTQEETSKLIMAEQFSSLQNKLQDKEEHLRNLQEKYAEVISQLDILRSETEDEKITHENKFLEQQEEYEKQIQDLTLNNKSNLETYEQTYKTELTAIMLKNDELMRQNGELCSKINEAESKISDLNNQILLKDSEIYQKTQEFTITFSRRNEEFENVRTKLIDYEKKIEDLSYEKESELAVLRLKMHEKQNLYENIQKESDLEKDNLIEALNAKITECTSLNKQITDLNKTLEEQSVKAAEMQAALENQEIEIVALKDEISDLQNMLKSSNSKIQKHVSFASDTKPGSHDDKSASALNRELLDAVPRAELDLALYMLHQRDVRCEELTMELTHLLDERDTLQLRLSDSLRSNEEMKTRSSAVGLDESITSSQETISELPSFSIEKEQHFVDTHRGGQTSRSSSISDPDGDRPKLQAKLSELRSVKHSRDVRLRQESEQRQLDLRLLQRDVAHLPPEAVDQLAQAHHTLSRDSQSTPTVLLNWLRGKSTPKVVHM